MKWNVRYTVSEFTRLAGAEHDQDFIDSLFRWNIVADFDHTRHGQSGANAAPHALSRAARSHGSSHPRGGVSRLRLRALFFDLRHQPCAQGIVGMVSLVRAPSVIRKLPLPPHIRIHLGAM